ncbi:hypothetical protein COOONC_07230 [Cooperia oncophora]
MSARIVPYSGVNLITRSGILEAREAPKSEVKREKEGELVVINRQFPDEILIGFDGIPSLTEPYGRLSAEIDGNEPPSIVGLDETPHEPWRPSDRRMRRPEHYDGESLASLTTSLSTASWQALVLASEFPTASTVPLSFSPSIHRFLYRHSRAIVSCHLTHRLGNLLANTTP